MLDEVTSRIVPDLRGEQALYDIVAIAVHSREYLIAAGMIGARYPQIVAVKGFIDDVDIVALRETVHQGGRDGARAGPEADWFFHVIWLSIHAAWARGLYRAYRGSETLET